MLSRLWMPECHHVVRASSGLKKKKLACWMGSRNMASCGMFWPPSTRSIRSALLQTSKRNICGWRKRYRVSSALDAVADSPYEGRLQQVVAARRWNMHLKFPSPWGFSLAAFFFNSLRSLWAIYENAQIILINLRKRTLQITVLFGHAHTTHNAVKYINVYVNIYMLLLFSVLSDECK